MEIQDILKIVQEKYPEAYINGDRVVIGTMNIKNGETSYDRHEVCYIQDNKFIFTIPVGYNTYVCKVQPSFDNEEELRKILDI